MFRTYLKIQAIGMKNKKKNIKVVATSIIGPLHETKKMPCQDYCRYSDKGKNFVAIVSDGAGSAKYGKIGARIICETMIDLLENIPFKNIKERIVEAIEIARGKLLRHRLNKTKNEEGITDFAATIVGYVSDKKQGLFFHIGDGAALAIDTENNNEFIVSRPHNGLFACETFFYTMDDWKDFLRFTSFEKPDTVFLMSDGLTNFAFSNDFSKLEKGFIFPINDFLMNEPCKNKAIRALNNTFNTPKAKKLNSDDKTLLWVKM